MLQISLAHLDDVLKSHPDVLEGVVFAKPHPEDSYHLTAFVVKKPKSNISGKDIINFVEGKHQSMLLFSSFYSIV